MNKLEYRITCLDGVYDFVAEYGDSVLFNVETDIASLKSFSGELDDEKSRQFIEDVEKAQIERWDREYAADLSGIEDGITWKLTCLKDGIEYVSSGEESYQPYNYEYLIRAIMLCDPESEYLF